MNRPWKNSRGFTVIELIVALVLVGILAAAVYPSFQGLSLTRAQAGAFRLRSDLRYLQLLAVQTQLATRALFDIGANTYKLQIQNGNFGNWQDVTNPGTKSAYTVQLNSGDFRGVTISDLDFNETSAVVFDRLGIPYDDNGAPILNEASASLSGRFKVAISAIAGKIEAVAL